MNIEQLTCFALGALYILIGLLFLMLIDVKTDRVETATNNNDFAIYLLVLFWPITSAILFLPRYKSRRRFSL